jgi:hypothetical protein
MRETTMPESAIIEAICEAGLEELIMITASSDVTLLKLSICESMELANASA